MTIGDSGAPSNQTIYYDELLSTTLMARKKSIFDTIFKEHAFLSYLRMSGGIDYQDGGERITVPLMYADNDTIKTHGGYSIIDTTPQDSLTTAFFNWAEIAGSITISRKEERQNSGEGKLIDLLKSKIDVAEMTMGEKLNNDLVLGTVSGATFVPDTASDGSYGVLPLGYFFRKANRTNPTVGGNIGNIDASTYYSWWAHHTAIANNGSVETGNSFAISVSTYKGLSVALKRMLNFTSRGGGGAADLVLMNQLTFETYENALDDKVRYSNTKMADMGFDTIKLRGATCIWDEVVPDLYTGTAAIATGTAFFINTKFYNLMIDKETDIVTTPFLNPINQTVKTAKILFMGNATVKNMRKHGLLYGISQSIVA
ncbi:phage major capsid protein [Desulfobacter sp. UBA2225]|jgi:hypothetical protein|uniref:phage major capsid protein n=1 Tax=Desulfobacter sp. UBA2225 TaxID=1961413 RepID=UPI00257BC19C|nr:phage major capsid protein [Desulfobacter sp. UBA2225]